MTDSDESLSSSGPAADPGVTSEYPIAMAARIGSRFDLPAPLEAFEFSEKGNINRDTYLLVSGRAGESKEYLLQRINQQVFTKPRSVMAAMIASLEAQRKSVEAGRVPSGREWEVISLMSTRDASPYYTCRSLRGTTYWRLMMKIPSCRTFKSLSEVTDPRERSRIAEEAGRGLAMYGDFTSSMDISQLESPLPGYRDTGLYYDQLTSVLNGNRTLDEAADLLPDDPVVRQSTAQHFLLHLSPQEYRRRMGDSQAVHFVELTCREKEFALKLQRARESGHIRTVAIHGDTKLDNFLFSEQSGQVKALVDLDTIMPLTWLADWGDMMRSLVNVAGEKETDLDKIQVDMEIYEAVARGFLGTAREVTREEVELMVDAVEVIALELGTRFLTDYLRGDNYFKLSAADPPDLNKTRGRAQLTLFERLRQNADAARKVIESLV